MEMFLKIRASVKCTREIKNALDEINCDVAQTYRECYIACMESDKHTESTHKLKIETVLDYLHDELNTGHWSKIPLLFRQAFSAASVIKSLLILRGETETANLLSEALKSLDMGLLLGSPLEENSELLTHSASTLSQKLVEYSNITEQSHSQKLKNQTLKRKCSEEEFASFNSLLATEVDAISCPSIENFNKTYFTPQVPVKLQDCITHWPAMKKWTNVNYLLSVAGERTVPVEIGSHYADENWSQKLISLKDFINQYFLKDSSDKGYLAQHNLFDQIVELKNDIRVPEYCCLSLDYENSSDVDINAWFGPLGTVSPLHYDPKNNLLAQVFGIKQILLFSPEDSSYLYSYEDKLLHNTAQVDPLKPNLNNHPLFHKAKMYKCLLKPGEMLFIPVKWWHHVTSLEKSFSVSFWWQ